MGEFRLAPEAEVELDGIWLRIARESGSIDIANRVLDNITERFWLLAQHPYIGRRRDDDWRAGLRSFPVEEYIIVHRVIEDDIVLILHVIRGSRDIDALLSE
jgi:plasmid stabilization system protein ParE